MTFIPKTEAEQNKLKRDAWWSIYSPPLIALPSLGFPNHTFFEQLCFDAEPEVWPAPDDWQRFRLGIQFERLWQCALPHLNGYELLASNLQVQGPVTTLGEFDLILQHDQCLEHWELAVKFYLASGDASQTSAWFGPNPTDRLDLKLSRLVSHQMALTKMPAGQNLLTSKFGGSAAKVKAVVKGRLFHPFEVWLKQEWIYPETVAPDHLKGWWLTDLEFLSRFKTSHHRFKPLAKLDWLSELPAVPASEQLTAATCLAVLSSTREQYAHHVAMLDENGREIARGFVVMAPWLAVTQDQSPRAL